MSNHPLRKGHTENDHGTAPGLLMEAEITALDKVLRAPDHPFVVIIGGIKSIGAVAERIVPTMAIAYIAMALLAVLIIIVAACAPRDQA